MLYQADIYTDYCDLSSIRSGIAVKIHGAAMAAIKTEYAQKLHEKEYHPFSIFTVPTERGLIIRVSALNDEAKVIVDALASKEELVIYGLDKPVKILSADYAAPVEAQAAGGLIKGNSCTLQFVTPAMVKVNGKPFAAPELVRYFYSVVRKYNEFERAQTDFAEFSAAFALAEYRDYSLGSTSYNVSGTIIPGMTGWCTLGLPKDKTQSDLLKRMFAYSTYCGVGAKTGMGMGGMVVTTGK